MPYYSVFLPRTASSVCHCLCVIGRCLRSTIDMTSVMMLFHKGNPVCELQHVATLHHFCSTISDL